MSQREVSIENESVRLITGLISSAVFIVTSPTLIREEARSINCNLSNMKILLKNHSVFAGQYVAIRNIRVDKFS